MSDAETRHAASMLLRHRTGALAWTVPGDDRVEKVRFVLDPVARAVVTPVARAVVEAEAHVLHVPDEGDDALQLLLDIDRETSAPESLVDRWRIHHGDAPRRLPGDFKGEPGKVWWARFAIDSARLGPTVIDGEGIIGPNRLVGAEPRICRRLNSDREALRRVCQAVAGATPRDPVCVGLDEEGLHIRADGGLVRLDFGGPRNTEAKVDAIIDQWLAKAGAPRVSAAARPALRDAHVHLAEHGEALSCIDLSSCSSADEALGRIARGAEREPHAKWIRAIRARVNGWRPAEWPTPQLHDAAGGRPCIVRSFDHHALVASTGALGAAGVDGATPDPEGGVIERRDGAPTGLLLERACNLVWSAMPEPSPGERREHLRLALADLARLGFVEAHDMLSPAWMGPLLSDLAANGDPGALAVRVWLYPRFEELDDAVRAADSWACDTVRLAGAKLFLDGTLNSRTAWMLEPYPQPVPGHPRGLSLLQPGVLESALRRCDELGFPAAMHAIGDGAVRAALDALERLEPTTLGFRIEHCEFVDEADIPRFAQLGVIASVQPCHLLADVEALRTITPHRAHRAFPLRDLIDAATQAGFAPDELLWLGSDTPVVRPDPIDNIQAAVERRRAGDPAGDAIAPAQAISRDEAAACMASPGAGEPSTGAAR